MDSVRVIIVGTGGMAASHAKAYAKIDGARMVACVDTNPERLAAFQAEHGIERGFASVEEAIDWGEFDAASNVTPDAVHYPTTLPLLEAGKHVLCEKPLAETYDKAQIMASAAAKAGVTHMVNLSYREVPALMHAQRMIADGAIGPVRHFEASYLQSWLTQPAWGDWKTEDQWLWRLSTAHGSTGVLGDVGVHILDYASFAAGEEVTDVSCRLTTFDKAPGNRIGQYTLDANDSFAMHVSLSGGASGVIHASRMASGHLNDLRLRIFGTKGGLEAQFADRVSTLRASVGDDMLTGTWREIETPQVETNYARFISAVRTGQQVHPDFHRGASLQKVLDLAAQSDAERGISLGV